jgi:hypothetical protein
MAQDAPVDILCDAPGWSTSVTIFCDCDEMIDGPDVILRECPHRNGTRIEHCPKCDAVLGISTGPLALALGDEMPDCECWSK